MAKVGIGFWQGRERNIRFVDGQVIVRLQDSSGGTPDPSAVEEFDTWISDTHDLTRSSVPLPEGYFVYETTDRDRAIETLRVIDDINSSALRIGDVEPVAYPDGIMGYHAGPPADAGYAKQWALRAAGVEEAWRCQIGSEDVWLAIVDSGMPVIEAAQDPPWELVHLDLDDRSRFKFGLAFKAKLEHFEEFSHYGAAGGELPTDKVGHGSHVLGIMAAEAGNASGQYDGGTVGVNWKSPVYVTAMEPMIGADGTHQGSGASQMASALEELAAWMDIEGVTNVVINISLGGEDFTKTIVCKALAKVTAQGAVVVSSTGNSFPGTDPDCDGYVCAPATYAEDDELSKALISVGAMTMSSFGSHPIVAPWSNPTTGDPDPGPVTVVAPGSNIFSTIFDGKNPGWGTMEGTSQAAPLVAGIVSLYWSSNPHLSNSEVVQAVKDTAIALDGQANLPHRRWGFGRINAKSLICPDPPNGTTNDEESGGSVVGGYVSDSDSGGDAPDPIPQAIWRHKVERCAFDLSEDLLLQILEEDNCGEVTAGQLSSALWLKDWLGESDWDGTGRHSGGTT